jgi:hypothetical protein
MPAGGGKPPLRRIHDDAVYDQDLKARRSLEYHRTRSTEEIVESLRPRPGNDEPPRGKPDGRVLQGNTSDQSVGGARLPGQRSASGAGLMKPDNDRNEVPKLLYGPTVEYADGTVVPGQPLDVEQILGMFGRWNAETRRAFLCVFAHDLTVAIRALTLDRPVSDADLDRVWDINESLHQLTSCANPRKQWSAHDQALLLRAIVESSFDRGLDRWIGHALALAAGSMRPSGKPVAAK